jgi:hypothetical protein
VFVSVGGLSVVVLKRPVGRPIALAQAVQQFVRRRRLPVDVQGPVDPLQQAVERLNRASALNPEFGERP